MENKVRQNFIDGTCRLNTSCIKWDLQKERFGHDGLLPFWIADSDYRTCEEVTNDLVQRAQQGVFGYTVYDEEYRSIVKNWIKRRYHYDIENNYIITTPGVVTALYFAVNLFTKENDDILVSTPVYNPFFEVVKSNKRNLVFNKLIEDDLTYKIDFIDLEEKLSKAKMYILCNPHNPIGRVWKKEEIDKIVALCKKYNCVLVSDEIHCDIIMGDNKFYSVGNYFNDYDNIIVCTAPSKTFNIAGLMDSNILIKNEKLRKLYKDKFEEMSLRDPNIFGICACKSAYTKGDNWVDEQNKYLYENYSIVKEFFNTNIKKAIVYNLEGTYLVWINLKFLGLSQSEIFNGLMDEGVLINNGTVYSKDHEGYIRFNLACGRKQLQEGLNRIKKFVDKFEKE